MKSYGLHLVGHVIYSRNILANLETSESGNCPSPYNRGLQAFILILFYIHSMCILCAFYVHFIAFIYAKKPLKYKSPVSVGTAKKHKNTQKIKTIEKEPS